VRDEEEEDDEDEEVEAVLDVVAVALGVVLDAVALDVAPVAITATSPPNARPEHAAATRRARAAGWRRRAARVAGVDPRSLGGVVMGTSGWCSTAASPARPRARPRPRKKWVRGVAAQSAGGNVIVSTAPPSGAFVARTSPPDAWAASRTIERPSPEPGRLRTPTAR